MILLPLGVVTVGLVLLVGAPKIDDYSADLHRRAPHLLPLRARFIPREIYVISLRLFGAVWIAAGMAILYWSER